LRPIQEVPESHPSSRQKPSGDRHIVQVGVRRAGAGVAGFAGGTAVAAVAAGDGSRPANAIVRGQPADAFARVLEHTVRNKGQWLLITVLAALLIMVAWYGVAIWQATPSMPLYGNIIVGVATALALVAGCGLKALMYHSRCKGYDEPARAKKTPEDDPNSI